MRRIVWVGALFMSVALPAEAKPKPAEPWLNAGKIAKEREDIPSSNYALAHTWSAAIQAKLEAAKSKAK